MDTCQAPFTKLVSSAILCTGLNSHMAARMARKKTEYYVNNKEFLANVIQLRDYFLEGKNLGHETHIESIRHFRFHKDRRTSVQFKRCYEYLGLSLIHI